MRTRSEYEKALLLLSEGRSSQIVGADTTLGGRAANQATAAARLGAATHLIGRIGLSESEDIFRALSSVENLNLDGLRVSNALPTGVCVLFSNNGHLIGETDIGANNEVGDEELGYLAQILDTGDTLLLTLDVPPRIVTSAVKISRAKGARVILDPSPTKHFPVELMRLVDIITPSDEELTELTGVGTDDAEVLSGATTLLSLGVGGVIVTRGAKGCLYLDAENGPIWMSPFRVEAVDTLGAGDCFNGSLAYAFTVGKPVRDRLRFATAASALSTTRRGAQQSMPSALGVSQLLGS